MDMAMMVVLLDHANGEFCLHRHLAEELAGLGVTSLTVVRNEQTVGIILEGWLFDPARSAGTAAAAVGAPPGAPVLHPILQAAVSAAVDQGGPDVEKVS
jgi:hypothetical protein